MSLLLLLPSEWFALIAILLLCGHVVTGPCIRTDVRPVCPAGLHVEGVLVICSRGTRVLVSLGKGEALTYPLGRVPTKLTALEDLADDLVRIPGLVGCIRVCPRLSLGMEFIRPT
jgi:hypothetical protein